MRRSMFARLQPINESCWNENLALKYTNIKEFALISDDGYIYDWDMYCLHCIHDTFYKIGIEPNIHPICLIEPLSGWDDHDKIKKIFFTNLRTPAISIINEYVPLIENCNFEN